MLTLTTVFKSKRQHLSLPIKFRFKFKWKHLVATVTDDDRTRLTWHVSHGDVGMEVGVWLVLVVVVVVGGGGGLNSCKAAHFPHLERMQ